MVDDIKDDSKKLASEQQKFKRNLGSLSNSIDAHTKAIRENTSKEVKLIDKSGMMNKQAVEQLTKELTKSKKEMHEPIKQLSESTDKLTQSAMSLSESSKEFNESSEKLSDVTEELNRSMLDLKEPLSYIGQGLTSAAKYGLLAGGGAALGYAATGGKWGAKKAANIATSPIRGAKSAYNFYAGGQDEFSRELMGDFKSDATGSFKKNLGAGVLSKIGGPIAGSLFNELFLNSNKKESMDDGGPGITAKTWEITKGLAKKTSDGFDVLKTWIEGMPSTKSGAMSVASADDSFGSDPSKPLNVVTASENILSPKTRMKVDAKLRKELKIKNDDKQTKILDDLRRSMKGTFELQMGVGKVLAYSVPIFGMGYRSELPDPKKGIFQAINQTLGIMYVAQRFASSEINDLILAQSRLLQIGLNVEGSLEKPRARSLGQLLGGMLKQKMFAGSKLGGLLGIGKTPGEGFSEVKKGAKIKPMAAVGGLVIETGDATVHKGEMIGQPKELWENLKSKFGGGTSEKARSAGTTNGEEQKPGGGGFFGGILSFFTAGLSKIPEILREMWASIEGLPKRIAESIKDLWTSGTRKGKNVVDSIIEGIRNLFVGEKEQDEGKSFLGNLLSLVYEKMRKILIGDKTKVGDKATIFDKLETMITDGYNILIPDAVKKAVTAIGNLPIEITNVMLGLIEIIKSNITPIIDSIRVFGGNKSINEKIAKTPHKWVGGKLKEIKLVDGSFMGILYSMWGALSGITGSIVDVWSKWLILKDTADLGLAETISELKVNFINKILPDGWAKIFEEIQKLIIGWQSAALASFKSTFNIEFKKIFEEKKGDKKGIVASIVSGFATIFKAIEIATEPYIKVMDTAVDKFLELISAIDVYIKTGLEKNLKKDWEQLGDNKTKIKKEVMSMYEQMKEATAENIKADRIIKGTSEFAVGGQVANDGMAKVHKGEFIMPVSQTLDEIITQPIVAKLQEIVDLFSAGGVKGTQGVLSKIAGGITDLSISAVKLPFTIAGAVGKGLWEAITAPISGAWGIAKGLGGLIYDTVSLPVKGLWKTLNYIGDKIVNKLEKVYDGVLSIPSKIGKVMSGAWTGFKKFLMSPFQGIIDKFTKAKNWVKGKAQNFAKKILGMEVIGKDADGKAIYAKWPSKVISLLKQGNKYLKSIDWNTTKIKKTSKATSKVQTWFKKKAIMAIMASIGGAIASVGALIAPFLPVIAAAAMAMRWIKHKFQSLDELNKEHAATAKQNKASQVEAINKKYGTNYKSYSKAAGAIHTVSSGMKQGNKYEVIDGKFSKVQDTPGLAQMDKSQLANSSSANAKVKADLNAIGAKETTKSIDKLSAETINYYNNMTTIVSNSNANNIAGAGGGGGSNSQMDPNTEALTKTKFE